VNFLLDTCVISELAKRPPDPNVVAWIDQRDEATLFLSAVTLGEIRSGIEQLPGSRRRDKLMSWLEHDVLVRFSGRLIALDAEVFLRWGVLVGSRNPGHRTLPVIDSLIAACALQHRMTLATRNEADLAGLGVSLLNPWRPSSPTHESPP
jgi:toxin FitB